MITVWCFFSLTLLLSVRALTFFPATIGKNYQSRPIKHNQRNLESIVKSTTLTDMSSWYNFEASSNFDDSDALWVIFISSNETILSDGNCSLFENFTCSSPACTEDSSSFYSEDFPFFSSDNSTRINLLSQTIAIADDAWKLNSSPIYIHNCNHLHPQNVFSQASGQIGLGLSGNAITNYQNSDPVFSIMVEPGSSAELIFGFNASYVNDTNTGISLPSDLDWKMQVLGVSIGSFNFSSTSVTMIFDIQTEKIKLPELYYSSIRDYFFNMTSLASCYDESSINAFVCIHLGSSVGFPSLTFMLENGTQFTIPPESYTERNAEGYTAMFAQAQYNSTFSGIDYIILGQSVMSQFYTVFQQVNGQNPTITLYPLTSESSDSNTQPQTDPNSSNASSNTSSPTNSSIDPTPVSNSSGTTNTSDSNSSVIIINDPQPSEDPSTSPPADTSDIPNASSNKDKGSDYTVVYVIVGLLLVAVICTVVGILGKRKGWFKKERFLEADSPTVELNDSSFMTASHSFHNDDNFSI